MATVGVAFIDLLRRRRSFCIRGDVVSPYPYGIHRHLDPSDVQNSIARIEMATLVRVLEGDHGMGGVYERATSSTARSGSRGTSLWRKSC